MVGVDEILPAYFSILQPKKMVETRKRSCSWSSCFGGNSADLLSKGAYRLVRVSRLHLQMRGGKEIVR